MMPLLLLTPPIPKIGLSSYLPASSEPRYEVFEGGLKRIATFTEKRQIQAASSVENPIPPPDPTGHYRFESTTLFEIKGYNVVDRRGTTEAGVKDQLVGCGDVDPPNWLTILGWGGLDNLIINRHGGSASVGEVGTIVSLNVRTHRLNPRVVLSCGKGYAIRIGDRATVAWGDPKRGVEPLLYRLVPGKAPMPLRFEGKPLRSTSIKIAPAGRWIMVYGQAKGNYQNFLVDLATGNARKVPGDPSSVFLR